MVKTGTASRESNATFIQLTNPGHPHCIGIIIREKIGIFTPQIGANWGPGVDWVNP